MKRILKQLLCLVLLGILAGGSFSCQTKFERTKAREMARGVRYDSLFFGIHLNMERPDFFKRCWQLNQRKVLTNGAGGNTVETYLSGVTPDVKMNFYPEFVNNRIAKIPVNFSYRGWSPWNKELHSSVLLPVVVKKLEKWYGKGFVKMEHPEKGVLFYKIDGNRQILVVEMDEQYVKALFTDLTAPEPPKGDKPQGFTL